MAGLFVMGMYWPEIQAMNEELIAAGKPLVANGGPASILCSFPSANQTNLGYLFMIEFFVDSFIGIVIWSCLDPANVRFGNLLLSSWLRSSSLFFTNTIAALCLSGISAIRHRIGICMHGLGLRGCYHFDQSGP